MPKITYRDPMGQDASIELSESFSEITIGRNPGNVICVNNPSLSRSHARIVFEQGVCTFYDLNSSNGSFINGKEVHNQPLKHGDRLRCGEFPLEFWSEPASQSAPARLPPEANTFEPAATPPPQSPLPQAPPPQSPVLPSSLSGAAHNPASMSGSGHSSSSLSSAPHNPASLSGSAHSASNMAKAASSPSRPLSARPGPTSSPQDPGMTWQPDHSEELERLRRQIKERDQDLERARGEHERLVRQAEDLQKKLSTAQQAPQDPLGDILKSLHQINAHLGEVCHKLEAYAREQG